MKPLRQSDLRLPSIGSTDLHRVLEEAARWTGDWSGNFFPTFLALALLFSFTLPTFSSTSIFVSATFTFLVMLLSTFVHLLAFHLLLRLGWHSKITSTLLPLIVVVSMN